MLVGGLGVTIIVIVIITIIVVVIITIILPRCVRPSMRARSKETNNNSHSNDIVCRY